MNVKTKNQAAVDITVADLDDIKLTVTIGNGQIGGSVVKFTGDPNNLALGNVNGLLLGNGNAIKGKTLQVTSNVFNTNGASQLVAVTHNFANGNPGNFQLNDNFDNPGDAFSWVTSYNFI